MGVCGLIVTDGSTLIINSAPIFRKFIGKNIRTLKYCKLEALYNLTTGETAGMNKCIKI